MLRSLVRTMPIMGASAIFKYSVCASSTERAVSKTKVGICQIRVTANKDENIEKAKSFISEAKGKGAELVVLPEIWNSPYSNASFPKYAEQVPAVGGKACPKTSPSAYMLCNEAKRNSVWLVGGSIPERDSSNGSEKLYNTCIIVNPEGNIVGKHRKVHLFDIDVPGRITFKESDTLTAGASVTVVDMPWGKVGVGICYDLRFPELSTVMRQRGANMLIFPGAFNMTTGPLHWELLQRARAVDNQCYVVTCSPARDKSAGYVAYGHSHVISPMGEVILDAGTDDKVDVIEIDMANVDTMRQNIPCWTQKRADLYVTKDNSLSTNK